MAIGGIRSLIPLLLIGGSFFATSTPLHAFAADPTGVLDNAGIFGSDTIHKATQQMDDLKQRHGFDLRVESYKSFPDAIGKEFDEAGNDTARRDGVYKSWASEKARQLGMHGVYVLVMQKHRRNDKEVSNHLEIIRHGLNAQQEKAFPSSNVRTMFQGMVKEFRTDRWDAGLLDGVKYVHGQVGAHMPESGHENAKQPGAAAGSGFLSHWLGWACLGVGALALIWLVVGLFRGMSGGGRPAGVGYGAGAPGLGGSGGGGFFSSLLGGMFGAAAGMWMYDNFFGGRHGGWGGGSPGMGDSSNPNQGGSEDVSAGGDFDSTGNDNAGGGGDFGAGDGGDGGGDFGGGDFGGGDFGGRDFGGGDFGGGGDF